MILYLIYLDGESVNTDQSYFHNYYRDAIVYYKTLHPEILSEMEAFSEFYPTETVNVTDRLREYKALNPEFFSKFNETELYLLDKLINPDPKYKRVFSLILRNKIYILQYNLKDWYYLRKGVPLLISYGMPDRETFEDFKKEYAKDRLNYNSLDLDSPYDGISNIFYQRVMYRFKS